MHRSLKRNSKFFVSIVPAIQSSNNTDVKRVHYTICLVMSVIMVMLNAVRKMKHYDYLAKYCEHVPESVVTLIKSYLGEER